MPDTFDLDQAFRDLEQDLAGRSTPRGAGFAISTARRRRRTTIGGVVVGLALVVGGVALAQETAGTDHTVAPAHGLPAPAPLDGPHLSAATAGWTPAWTADTEGARQKMSQTFGGDCLAVAPGGRAAGITAFGNSHDDLAIAILTTYGEQVTERQRAWRRVEQQLDGCHGAELVSSFSDPSGAAGRLYRIAVTESETAPQYEWIVTTADAIGVLKIMDQSDPLPAELDRPTAQALLAAVQDPSSFQSTPSTDQPALRVEEGDFARSLRGWQSGWARSADQGSPALTAPCYAGRWQQGSWTSKHEGLGGNGRQDVALFHTVAEARAAATSLVNALQECRSARYGVTHTSHDARSLLVVASGPSIVWVAQQDDAVGVVRVPSGGAAPPRPVTVAVGGVMSAWITAFAS
jgi:hypothetical protein